MTIQLSARESDVARLVAEELADKEIANILRISTRTVQSYLDRIAHKISAGQSSVARRRAIRQWVEQQAPSEAA